MTRKVGLLAFAIGAASLLLHGCANVTSGGPKVALTEKPSDICIIRNAKVTYAQGLPSLQRAFQIRGIDTYVVDMQQECRPDNHWQLDYSMRRSWDLVMYLRSVQLILRKDGTVVSEASYEAGPLTLTKFGRADDRIDGVVKELLDQ